MPDTMARGSGLAEALHSAIQDGNTPLRQYSWREQGTSTPLQDVYDGRQVTVGNLSHPDDHTSEFETKIQDRRFKVRIEAL